MIGCVVGGSIDESVLGDTGRAQFLKDAARDGRSALCRRHSPSALAQSFVVALLGPVFGGAAASQLASLPNVRRRRCGSLVCVDRLDAHNSLWCPALPSDDETGGGDNLEGGDSMQQ